MMEQLIGIISDTHGLVRPEAVEALKGVDLILYAGDVGGAEVLETLKGIAPATQHAPVIGYFVRALLIRGNGKD